MFGVNETLTEDIRPNPVWVEVGFLNLVFNDDPTTSEKLAKLFS